MCSTASNLAGLLNVKDTSEASKIADSTRRIVDLTQAVSRVEKLEESSSASNDWTDTYKYWDEWEDVEVLRAEVNSEKDRLEALLEKNSNPMGHCHSHTEVALCRGGQSLLFKPRSMMCKHLACHCSAGCSNGTVVSTRPPLSITL